MRNYFLNIAAFFSLVAVFSGCSDAEEKINAQNTEEIISETNESEVEVPVANYELLFDKWWKNEDMGAADQFYGKDGTFRNDKNIETAGTWTWVEKGRRMNVTIYNKESIIEIKEVSPEKMVIHAWDMDLVYTPMQ